VAPWTAHEAEARMTKATVQPFLFKNQPALQLRCAAGSTAVVLEHGAHLLSWIPAADRERLYLSPQSAYGAGASVRGGVPVIFPQFNQRGPLPRHGLARTRRWQVQLAEVRGTAALAVLRLADDDETRALWPHAFEAELTICIDGERLDVELAVSNRGAAPWSFMAALHSYFAVGEVESVRIEGLSGLRYEDFAQGGVMREGSADAVTIGANVDRIYFDVPRRGC
jgi:glucose-6-phosphate 1-epimerase